MIHYVSTYTCALVTMAKTCVTYLTSNQIWSRRKLLTSDTRTYLPAATKLGQGNIFRSVYQEFCPQGWSPIFQGWWWWSGPRGGFSKFSGVSPILGGFSTFSGGVVVWSPGVLQIFGRSPIILGVGGLQFWGGVSKFSNFPNTFNERPVRILLECILVVIMY